MTLTAFAVLAAAVLTGPLAAAQPGSRDRGFQREHRRDEARVRATDRFRSDARRHDDRRHGRGGRGDVRHGGGRFDHRAPVVIVRPPARHHRSYYVRPWHPRPRFDRASPRSGGGLFFNLRID